MPFQPYMYLPLPSHGAPLLPLRSPPHRLRFPSLPMALPSPRPLPPSSLRHAGLRCHGAATWGHGFGAAWRSAPQTRRGPRSEWHSAWGRQGSSRGPARSVDLLGSWCRERANGVASEQTARRAGRGTANVAASRPATWLAGGGGSGSARRYS
jgi:hypothetical protein